MLEVCKANIGNKVVLVYEEGAETKGATCFIREANENFVLIETDCGRRIWLKPETIIKIKEVRR
ncbi:MAG: hypothetical protein QME47_07985 [Candidatus Thermoplasmatota archaeon]|nr:hypothetical protein [Candidatus Thermoplasmatota archaeon]